MQVNDLNRNRRFIAILSAACVLLQLALAPHVAFGNGHPNFCLVLTGCAALALGGRRGVIFGFLTGLFFDLCTTGPVGLMAFELTLAGFFLGSEIRNRIKDDTRAAILNFLIAAAIVELVYNSTMLVVGQATSLVDVIVMRALPSTILDVLMFVPLAFILARGPQGPSLGHGSAHLGAGGKGGTITSIGR